MRHDIHVQRHVGSCIDVHHHIHAIRDCGLKLVILEGQPVGIAEMFSVYDVLVLQPPQAAGVDNGFYVMVEEVKIVVFQQWHFFNGPEW